MDESTSPATMKEIKHLHCISDSTGLTIRRMVPSVATFFSQHELRVHHSSFIKSASKLERALEVIAENPGPILYTLFIPELRARLEAFADEHDLPCTAILSPVLTTLLKVWGTPTLRRAGQQYDDDKEGATLSEALGFALETGDGRHPERLGEADVVLVGVPNCSKTHICMFLATLGIRAANIQLVRGVDRGQVATRLASIASQPLVVGLTRDANSLANLRNEALESHPSRASSGDEPDFDKIRAELTEALHWFQAQGWDYLNITSLSIEESVGQILELLERKRSKGDGTAGTDS